MTGPEWFGGRPAVARWSGCLLLILGLHAGLVLLVQRQVHPVPPSAPAEAVLLELAPEPAQAAAPPVPAASVGMPPLAEALPPEPASLPELAADSPIPEMPPLPPTPLPEPAPLPEPQAVSVPPVEPPPPPPSRPRPERRHLARRAPAAPPPEPAEAEVPPQPVAAPRSKLPPVAASPTADPQAAASWRGLLIRRLQAAKRYPERARSRGDQGVALATFTMDRAGRVVSASLARSSGSVLLDEEAVAMIHRAEPLPPPPPELAGGSLTFTVPVSFALR